MDLLIKKKDLTLVKSTLMQAERKTYSQSKLDIKQLLAFFCSLDEVSEKGFTLAEKRDVLQPLKMNIDYEQTTQISGLNMWTQRNEFKIDMNEVILKLSMDDLYIFNAIVEKQLKDIQALQQVWNDFSDKSQISRHKYEETKTINVENEDSVVNQLDFKAQTIEALVINEQDGGYVPLFFAQCKRLSCLQRSDQKECSQQTYVRLDIGLDYFNASSGCYEPLVELFPVELNLSKKHSISDTFFVLSQPININLTVGLASCLSKFHKLWDISS